MASALVRFSRPMMASTVARVSTALLFGAGIYCFLRRRRLVRSSSSSAVAAPTSSAKPLSPDAMIGLEVFDSSGPKLFDGSKKISIRDFPLPAELCNRPLALLSRPDPPNSEPLPDELAAGAGTFALAGFVVFSEGAKPYATRAAFEADAALHQVLPGSKVHAKYVGDGSRWPGPLGPIYAWHIKSATPAPAAFVRDEPTPALRRRHKALFEVDMAGWMVMPAKPKAR